VDGANHYGDPVTNRQQLPDELRGLALLGIVVVNVPFLGISLGGFGAQANRGMADQLAEFAVTAFAQGKFYLLFAFLFGYSAAPMMPDASPASSVRFARRLAGLAVLGICHALLFFVGDILLTYACLGVALLLLRRSSDRMLMRVATTSAGLALCWLTLIVVLAALYPTEAAEDFGVLAYDSVMSGGTFGEAIFARLKVYPEVLLLLATLNAGLVLSAFCLGMMAGRQRLLSQPDTAHPLWRACRRWGLYAGLPGGLLAAVLTMGSGDAPVAAFQSSTKYVLGIAIGFITAPALAAGYMGWIIAARSRNPALLRLFRPAGQMSLTLYLGESVLLSAVFGGWGLGLFGRWGAVAVVAMGMGVWLVLDLFAHWWMHRFRYGPAEAMLRWWSTGERPSMRIPVI
jgi:uncharacterized protein